MAENLNYNAKGSKCYENIESNCQKYGRLYNWSTAKTACPKGWHLPSDAEWDVLVNYAGGFSAAGKKLKATNGWHNNGNGEDKFGFAALPGGYGNSYDNFYNVGYDGYWWESATEIYAGDAYYRSMYYLNESVDEGNNLEYYDLFNVRCVRD